MPVLQRPSPQRYLLLLLLLADGVLDGQSVAAMTRAWLPMQRLQRRYCMLGPLKHHEAEERCGAGHYHLLDGAKRSEQSADGLLAQAGAWAKVAEQEARGL